MFVHYNMLSLWSEINSDLQNTPSFVKKKKYTQQNLNQYKTQKYNEFINM